jgi:hypothetical protein
MVWADDFNASRTVRSTLNGYIAVFAGNAHGANLSAIIKFRL